MKILRPMLILAGLLAAWQAVIWLTGVADFILPPPATVLEAWITRFDILAAAAAYTLSEILLGLLFGLVLGCATALAMAYHRPAREWLLPVMVTSQAIPVFALAPVLVLWFGYGLWSKVVMATLIIYFPVTAAFFDGLRRTEPGWLDLAHCMGGSRWTILRQVRIPAALPALGSGIRVATAVAPIGAVVGEWVGASAGLGYVMLHAKGRSEEPLMFAALFTLAIMAVALYFAVDWTVRHALRWQPETNPTED